MDVPKDCPRCRLVNPPSAARCDCGYDFISRKVEGSFLSRGESERAFGKPTAAEYLLCLLVPGWGLLLALTAKREGRGTAGSRMFLVAFAVQASILTPFVIAFFVALFSQAR